MKGQSASRSDPDDLWYALALISAGVLVLVLLAMAFYDLCSWAASGQNVPYQKIKRNWR